MVSFLALRPERSEGRRGFRVSEPGHQDCGGGGEGVRVGARLLGERRTERGSAGRGRGLDSGVGRSGWGVVEGEGRNKGVPFVLGEGIAFDFVLFQDQEKAGAIPIAFRLGGQSLENLEILVALIVKVARPMFLHFDCAKIPFIRSAHVEQEIGRPPVVLNAFDGSFVPVVFNVPLDGFLQIQHVGLRPNPEMLRKACNQAALANVDFKQLRIKPVEIINGFQKIVPHPGEFGSASGKTQRWTRADCFGRGNFHGAV